MTTAAPLIALVHATPAAIAPARAAIQETLPEATLWNVLDDRLQQDATRAGRGAPQLVERMRRLVSHVAAEGADAVLLTCSLYGFAAERLGSEIGLPVLSPDGAAFGDVLRAADERVLVLASVPEALEDSRARLTAAAGPRVLQIEGAVADGAYEAASRGDRDALLDSLVAAVGNARADAIHLAQYSLSPVMRELADRTGTPVFAGPTSAALALRARVEGAEAP